MMSEPVPPLMKEMNLHAQLHAAPPFPAEFDSQWVNENTAFLVIHGIGNQNPLETLDNFCRGLAETYQKGCTAPLVLEHHINRRNGTDEKELWFENFIRIKRADQHTHIDVYEFYWANHIQTGLDFNTIHAWLKQVTRGARKFYNRNRLLGEYYGDRSIFFDKKGHFNYWTYKLVIEFAAKSLLLGGIVSTALLKALSYLPFAGELAVKAAEGFLSSYFHELSQVIGDVVTYNTTDFKSKHYETRKKILNASVNTLKYLVEKREEDHYYAPLAYPKIILAGHSLGSQITFDTINRFTHLINEGEVKHYTSTGSYIPNNLPALHISNRLHGLITFGSPLDKIAFFLREHVPEEEYLRQQMTQNYHCFKQRDWQLTEKVPFQLKNPYQRFFEQINWRNYYDLNDYVSGGLDYYQGVTNVNCNFPKERFSFTHSNYWHHQPFYRDIIKNLLPVD